MKNSIFKLLISCITLVIICSLSGCKKFLQVDSPISKAERAKVFADDQTATAATLGLYHQMTAYSIAFNNGAITIYTGLSADEIQNPNADATYDAFKANALPSDNAILASTLWSNAYKIIFQANATIEGLNASNTVTPALKQQLLGEMLYIRALEYFYMVNLFGAVPLELTTDYRLNGTMPRTPVEKVYEQITLDLIQSAANLKPGFSTAVNTRPNEAAALALLARVYLYQNKWNLAEQYASQVINSNKFVLSNLNAAFISSSTETLFQLMKSTGNTSEAGIFVPFSTTIIPTFKITESLLNSFEAGDNRKTTWMKSTLINGQTYYYPNKYKVNAALPVSEFYIVQRLAEIYLIRSEARTQLDNLNNAIVDLDMLRERAGLPKIQSTYPSINKADLLNAIAKERRIELFAEWGHRWFDLKRTGKSTEVLGLEKGSNWQPHDELYPIPFSELQLNPALTQNPGY
ncbi:RagB/SusD family nutrient uptake outer membrane protein [Pedobacter nototheniae]|uniref:RagB/SusD family nutrient uptake outer membrane protein n=1 Tax=Pedobacter nototheniae TaxID=2488994 RepID=UPI001039093C|nr:RagB/SusD family nutrient uptake outer membrane protein [Pedobacter nototheniae]